MSYASLVAIIAAASLTACASVEAIDGEAREIASNSIPETPQTWAAVAERVGDVEVGWISAFEDPVLEDLIEEALANNKNLQAAAANVDRSWALAQQAGAALTPSVGLSADAGGSGITDGGSTSDINVGLQASWELDVWGRIRSGQAAAVGSAEAAEADYRFAQQSLAAAVARSYFITIEADRQTAVVEGVLEALARTNRIVELQFENGLATAQDVALAKSELATSTDQLESAKGGRRDALRALELILGRYPGAELEVRDSLPETPAPPPAGLPSQILERRPDLVAAERRIAATINTVNQAKAAKLPSISLTGGIGGSSDDLSNLLNPANVAWQAASNLLLPVIDGGALDAQVDVTTADQRAAVAAYADAALTAFAEVETSLDQGQVLVRRDAALSEARRESEEALRLAQLRFDEGESDLLDVLSIQQRVFSAQSNALAVERLRLEQFIDLNLALGGDWRSTDEAR